MAGKRKRGNGEGTIYQRKDGRWCGMATVGHDSKTGKPKRRAVYGKTRREAGEKLAKLTTSISEGQYNDCGNITVQQYLDDWLKNYAINALRPKTYWSYEMVIRLHIVPQIGKIRLKDLGTDRIQILYNQKANNGRNDGKGGLAPRSVERIHTVLHKALEQAVITRKIGYNPAKGTVLTLRTQKEVRALTPQEQDVFESALMKERLQAGFLIGLYGGLRRGEVLGLEWSDINFDECSVTLEREILRYKDKGTGESRLDLQPLKTKKSYRTVPLPEVLLNHLKKHKAQQAKEQLKAGPMYQNQNLVFCTTLGTFIEPRNYNRTFSRIIKNAGIENFNLHGLRHTYTTRLAELGIDPKIRQELLGHEKSSTTEGYTHILWEMMKMAVDRMNDYMLAKKNPSIKEG